MIPAEALEQAVLNRILSLGTRDEDRDKVVQAAARAIEAEADKMDSEVGAVRHRLTTVQTQIQNLIGALKTLGAEAVGSVKDELAKLEEEKRQLRARLEAHAEQTAPAIAAANAAKTFIDTWSSVGELLEQATPAERRTILQHYVEVVEISFDDPSGKLGRYALRLFPEVRPLDATPSRNENGTPVGGSVLTGDRTVCQYDQKAPRQGLEPWTKRLTAACSTN
jgi:site-specific DNA recombinase